MSERPVPGSPSPSASAELVANLQSSARSGAWALISRREWRRWTLASFMARLPQPMSLLAFQLAGLQVTGSIGKGAILVGITGFCGMLGPWTGRRRDRSSMRRQLQISSAIGAAALSGMAVCVQLHASYTLLVALSMVQGSAIAGMWPGFRALLVEVAPGDLLHNAHFVESFMVELSFCIGPLLVTAIIALLNVTAALGAMALAALAGGVVLYGVPDIDRRVAPEQPRRRLDPTRVRAMGVLSGCAFVLALGFSMVESNVPSRMAPYHLVASSAGTYMAVLAGGSCLGGLLVTLRPLPQRRPWLHAGLLFMLLGALSLPSALAGSATVFLATLPINSLALVPLNGIVTAEFERRVGRERRGEAFGWYNAAMRLGGGVGATANGLLLAVLRPAEVPLIASGLLLAMGVALITPALARAER